MARKKKTGRKIVVFSLILATLGGLGWYAFYKKREDIITVQTEKVGRRDLTELVVATGKIQPVVQVKISPEVSGEIIELPVKEGEEVKKGDLLLKIKPDFYLARRDSADANLKAVLANKELAGANLGKAKTEFKRAQELYQDELISESVFVDARTALDVAQAQVKAATHQSEVARASLASAEEELAKTTIYSPLTGVVTKLNSEVGERVVGTATMAGTEVMIVSNLEEMEARVDIGEIDVVLIALDQKARLEVDAFREKKFTGVVTEIANTAKTQNMGSQQEATRFEVMIRVNERAVFRPGMSVTAEVETRHRTNVLAVPIQCVTTRLPKQEENPAGAPANAGGEGNGDTGKMENAYQNEKKKEDNKPIEVLFVREGDAVKMIPVKRGISDDTHVEILEGLQEGQEVISGGYKAINRDLDDGKKITVGPAGGEAKGAK
jgi:HlyD family secretion protein